MEPNSLKLAEQLEDPKPVDVFNCVLNAIENAVKDTKLAPVYDQYRAHLEEELDEMVVCIRDQIGSEQEQWVSFDCDFMNFFQANNFFLFRCVRDKVKDANQTLIELFVNMAKVRN